MSDKLADHPHLPVLLLPILPLPSSSLTCSIFFSFWYTISNPPPEKNGLQTPPFHRTLKGFGFHMHPLPPSDQKRQASPLPPPSGHKGEGIKTSSHPLLAKIGKEFKTPSSHALGKKRGELEKASSPPLLAKGRGNSNPPPPFPLHLLCSFPLPHSHPGP